MEMASTSKTDNALSSRLKKLSLPNCHQVESVLKYHGELFNPERKNRLINLLEVILEANSVNKKKVSLSVGNSEETELMPKQNLKPVKKNFGVNIKKSNIKTEYLDKPNMEGSDETMMGNEETSKNMNLDQKFADEAQLNLTELSEQGDVDLGQKDKSAIFLYSSEDESKEKLDLNNDKKASKKRFQNNMQNIDQESREKFMENLVIVSPKNSCNDEEFALKTSPKTVYDKNGVALKIPTKVLNNYISLLYSVTQNLRLYDKFLNEFIKATHFEKTYYLGNAYYIWEQYLKYAKVTMGFLHKYMHTMIRQCEIKCHGDHDLEVYEKKVPTVLINCNVHLKTWKLCLLEAINLIKDVLEPRNFTISYPEEKMQLYLKYYKKINKIRKFLKVQKILRLKIKEIKL